MQLFIKHMEFSDIFTSCHYFISYIYRVSLCSSCWQQTHKAQTGFHLTATLWLLLPNSEITATNHHPW